MSTASTSAVNTPGASTPTALPHSCVVAVIGSGAMGAGIAQVAAAAGYTVKLYDTRRQAVDKALQDIRKVFDTLVQKQRMSAEEAMAAANRLHPAASLAELGDAGLIVEAIVENLDIKRKLFADLEEIVADDCIFASNTSSISITSIGALLRLPQRLVGMHFFNPVPLMALVEVISGLASDSSVASSVYATALAWGKSPVYTKSTPGFIVNRVARPYYAEALRILNEQAATPATIDAILREAGGFKMGPFELMDLIGHDVNFTVTQSVFQAYFTDPRFTPSLIQQELLNAGYLGRKSGRGFYSYAPDAVRPLPQTESSESTMAAVKHRILFQHGNPLAQALQKRLTASGIVSETGDTDDDALLQCGSARLYLTDGRSATERARDHAHNDTVLLDLTLDLNTATRVALARADQCSDAAYRSLLSLLQAAGLTVSLIGDVPGMAVMRTVVMLANEAADAVNQGVCSAADADLAMRKGVNYPCGPLAWANAIGVPYLSRVLFHLADSYGEDRYRVSPLIRRKNANGELFNV
ncbi:3-hydroxyacyl-CoA dehydrogenase PaaH [Herbaspirillum sp. RTI4]|uniref:3-hydroxyacyl-CoA dehydrogenase PaaH n=1 Tax=Herbaspirillum sp. RTI4 TaxID=3048640 RepID=UPI002AB43480|nr:3-hydroxyacyl-CoA dehydrogenase PaaH [Herbaspirillum sp. RTI4]MDY7578118.1 3-hydroxyacyl-CoA dehydrogenase PaaH [Herbaspirillum sp. RTI4]MEA9980707.1 3-hydroxyacyl-CoA dehydrogenase PaaC [Herbaspirillum sp. RTI4]